MTNLEKLLKFLVNDNDIKELALKTNVSEEVTRKFCQDVFTRLIPNDFTKAEGSHIEEKDLRAIVSNFNLLLKEENLKPLMINGVKKYGLESSQSSGLVSGVLPIIHKKIQVLTKPKEKVLPKEEVKLQEDMKVEEKISDEETDEIFSSISKKASEDAKKLESQEVKKYSLFGPKSKEAKTENKPTKVSEPVEEIEDDTLTPLEKGCIYAVLVALVAIIIVFAVVLIKINL